MSRTIVFVRIFALLARPWCFTDVAVLTHPFGVWVTRAFSSTVHCPMVGTIFGVIKPTIVPNASIPRGAFGAIGVSGPLWITMTNTQHIDAAVAITVCSITELTLVTHPRRGACLAKGILVCIVLYSTTVMGLTRTNTAFGDRPVIVACGCITKFTIRTFKFFTDACRTICVAPITPTCTIAMHVHDTVVVARF